MVLLSTLHLALALYAVWFAATQRATRRLEEWGPQWLARLVTWSAARFAALLGISGSIRLDGVSEAELAGLRPAVLACGPHGAFALGVLLLHLGRLRLDPRFAHLQVRLASASVLFLVPGLRELLLLAGCREASKRFADAAVGAGHSIALNPGGVWEQTHTSDAREQLFFNRNLGFVRLAMLHGRPLVAAYAFGENALWRTHDTLWLRQREWLANSCRLGAPMISGRLGLPFGPPFAVGHALVLGKPVDVGPPNADPSAVQLEAAFQRYLAEVRRLFEAHKDEYLSPEVAARGLTVVMREARV